MDVNSCLRRRFSLRGFPPWITAGLLLLSSFSTSTTCLYDYDLPLRLASTTCLNGLPLRPASTVCLHHVIAIISIIIIVHLLFKRNIYLSLLYVIYVFFSSSFPEIIFPFLLLSMQLKNVMLICC